MPAGGVHHAAGTLVEAQWADIRRAVLETKAIGGWSVTVHGVTVRILVDGGPGNPDSPQRQRASRRSVRPASRRKEPVSSQEPCVPKPSAGLNARRRRSLQRALDFQARTQQVVRTALLRHAFRRLREERAPLVAKDSGQLDAPMPPALAATTDNSSESGGSSGAMGECNFKRLRRADGTPHQRASKRPGRSIRPLRQCQAHMSLTGCRFSDRCPLHHDPAAPHLLREALAYVVALPCNPEAAGWVGDGHEHRFEHQGRTFFWKRGDRGAHCLRLAGQ
jgi:hypothetical protein